jgi:hypothetical protein
MAHHRAGDDRSGGDAFGATFHVDARAAPRAAFTAGSATRWPPPARATPSSSRRACTPTVTWPITIGPDKPGLTITGSTVFLRDADGLPVEPVEATAAVVTGARSGLGYARSCT